MRPATVCPVCDGTNLIPYSASAWRPEFLCFAQARCGGCGLLISQPMPEPEDLARYYGQIYYDRERYRDWQAIFDSYLQGYREQEWPLLNQLWADAPPPPAGTVVEVGCGMGLILELFKENGFRTSGCDLGKQAVAWCRGRGHDVIEAPFPGSPLPRGTFDVAVALQVVEHTLEVRKFVQELVDLAKPGGWVAIATERAWNTQYAWERVAAWLRGRAPRFCTSIDHTYVFEPQHLRRLLIDCGCPDVRTRSYTHTPLSESLHYRLYRGTFRLLDRLLGTGECHLAVARKPMA